MNPSTRPPGDGRRALVQLRSLTKTYQEGEQERAVLRQLNADIHDGEFVVLMGRSGAGKSTLLNLISGIDRPTAGDVIVGDTNLTELSEHERTLFRRRHIGFVFQAFNLISTLTVEENITLPLELSGAMDATEQERALQVLDEVGLRDRADSFPDRLSGGEQQRVAIARALAHDPLLILTDEPTGNLDYDTGRQVLDLLSRLVRERGKTMLVATHDRSMIRAADRVLTLQSGTLEAHTPEELAGTFEAFEL
jgi:putative ABC transport system ATP-binding protein